jgi:hypothetical protein
MGGREHEETTREGASTSCETHIPSFQRLYINYMPSHEQMFAISDLKTAPVRMLLPVHFAADSCTKNTNSPSGIASNFHSKHL